MPSDSDYKETKQIMLGKAAMKQEFKKLAEWIDKKYDVKTINIVYDTIDKGQRPRLEICFEFARESGLFRDNTNMNFDGDKQNAIARKFKQTLEEQGVIEKKGLFAFWKKLKSKYMTDNIWVIYGAFEPIARIEANENIPHNKVVELKSTLNNKDLWEISRGFSGTTFFLYTDRQVKEYENSEMRRNGQGSILIC